MKILRKANKEDFHFFFQIKSEPKNILWTGHLLAPKKDQLYEWFEKKINCDDRKILIYEIQGQAVGYSYVIFDEANVETAVAVSEKYEGLGIGKEIVRATKDYCSTKLKINRLVAWIINDNEASKKIHLAAGYVPTNKIKLFNQKKMELFLWEKGDYFE